MIVKTELPKFVSSFRDRHGKMRYRFRRRGMTGYIHAEPGTLEFHEQYEALKAGLGPSRFRRHAGVQVYFMSDGEAVKIGYASDIAKRAQLLQTGSSRPIKLLAATPGSRGLERAYHRLFAEYRVRGRGEWFTLSADILAEVERLNGGREPLPLRLAPPKYRVRLSQPNDFNGPTVQRTPHEPGSGMERPANNG